MHVSSLAAQSVARVENYYEYLAFQMKERSSTILSSILN